MLPGPSTRKPAYLEAAEDLRRNPGQWQFYESTGHCVALAGPGSGKTKTLTIKMARLLVEDVRPPRGIACITFNNECVRELKRRLDALGVTEGRCVFIGTIHSFCLTNILKPYGRLAGLNLPEPLTVACNSDRQRAFDRACQDGSIDASGIDIDEMDRCRRIYIDRDTPEWQEYDRPIFSLIELYEQELHSNGLIDFDDMVLCGLRLCEQHEWIRKLLRARFPILIVDEYQDLGLPLHRLVLHLCFGAGVRLLAVGDPCQSIYGFMGAKPELLEELAKMEGINPVRLTINYRCGPTIAKASKMIFSLEAGEPDTVADVDPGTVDFYEFAGGIDEQARRICTEIIPKSLSTKAGRQCNNIAILYLDKNDGNVIADAVKAAGLKFVRIDRNAAYRKTPLTRWLEECALWCAGGWRKGEPRLSSLVRTWLGFNQATEASDARAQELRRQLVAFLWANRDAEMTLDAWLGSLDDKLLRHTFFRDCEQREDYEALDKLLSACAPDGEIAEFSVAAFAGQCGAPTHLNLITLHSAKGREFEVVVLMGMDQGRIPREDDDATKKAEKRRLFYVGVTRAKQEVHITFSASPSEFVRELCDRLQAR